MTNYRALIYPLIIIFVLGFIMNLTLGSFVDLTQINPNSALFNNQFSQIFIVNAICEPTFLDTIDTGGSLFGFNIVIPYINPMALFPQAIIDFSCNQITIISYIPDMVIIPLIIILSLLFIYGLIKIFVP